MFHAQDVIHQFGDSIGLGPIPLNEDGCAKLDFGDGLEVNFEINANESVLHVYATVGPVPVEGREALFAALLSANMFGSETAGHCLSIDRENQDILLHRSFDAYDLNFENFHAKLSTFIEVLVHWKERVQQPSASVAVTPDEEAPSFIRV